MLEEAKRKEVFCIANADLLAVIQSKWRKHMGISEPGNDDVDATIREVDDLMNQATLVSAQTQIEQAKKLFDPVFEDIERASLKVQQQQQRHEKKRNEIIKTREQKLRSLVEDSNTKIEQAAAESQNEELKQNREQRKRRLVQAAKIPWSLLDQLASERRKLVEEKSMFKVWKKPHASLRGSCDGSTYQNTSNVTQV